ncbi:ABC transporter ATP-binding protein [Corynebacterium ulcerans]|uniref:ABC transporter ATP-binding protein n=1 Tax=Corynebacterium ulcerans TaxID=65058 RepID=UPI0018DA19F9|nr:ABC transporter ATP-binding protein [Corynebacterium ulcerans]MBH5301679.1 ABC transporter ATP-binding protein [Corynebacterium ulcerans]
MAAHKGISAQKTSEDIIRVRNLDKSFGSFKALDQLDLSVARGEVHGFLGPNGAGKSTAIRVLLGLLKADAGEVELLGGDPWKDVVALHRRLAYVPGDVSLWPGMSGGEAIDLLGSLRGGLNARRRAELIERFELDPTKKGRQYSKGNRQKVALVAALASDAELLILDEPTSGLDPLMESVFQDVVREAKERGSTVFLSSHILAEVEALADRMSIIKAGRIVRTATLEELQQTAATTITAVLHRVPDAKDCPEQAHVNGNTLTVSVPQKQVGAILERVLPLGIDKLTVESPSLESLFKDLYGEESEPGEEQ